MCEESEAVAKKTPVEFSSPIARCCMKCKQPARIICRLLDPLCSDCFQQYFTHKFRSILGKSKAIRYFEKVLVAVSGGPSSSAMLRLIEDGLQPANKRRLQFQPAVLFVDEVAIIPDSLKQYWVNGSKDIKDVLMKTGFPVHVASLEDLFPKKESLTSLLNSLTSLTAKENMLDHLRNRLFVQVAQRHGYAKVLVGHSSTRLAVGLVAGVAEGKGASVAMDSAMLDGRFGNEGVSIIRPMREFSGKEIAYFNYANGVTVVSLPGLEFGAQSNASIGQLTESFITSLQAEFPSTVSTVFRTSDKLVGVDLSLETTAQCILCEAPMVKETCPGKCDGCSCKRQAEALTSIAKLQPHMCYSCRLLLKDSKEHDIPMPFFVTEQLGKEERRSQMRADIQDFLLESSDD